MYAHAAGIVHRDIKPENVLLSGRHALVTDFGVAKALEGAASSSTLTGTGMALGTPAYMSPEQVSGDPHLDHRTDIYAVGVIGYELLAGTLPFSGPTARSIMAGHLTQAPTPLIQLRPAIPPELSQTIMRCLEKRPSDRWQSAEELLTQLESLATPEQGTTPMAPPPLARRSERRAAWMLAGAVLALIAVVSLALQGRSPASREFPLPRRLTFRGDLLLASISPDGRHAGLVS